MDVIIALIISVPIFIFAHEFGHFLAARLTGMKVVRMWLGRGPAWATATVKDRHGTEFRFGIFPSFFAEVEAGEYRRNSPLRRLVFASGGPAFNALCTFVLLAIAYVVFHTPSAALIGNVDVEGRAFEAGVRSGDLIVAVDGRTTDSWADVGVALADRVGDTGTVALDVMRDGQQQYEVAVTDWQSDSLRIDMFEYLGVAPAETGASAGRIFAGIGGAFVDTFRYFWSTAMAGFKMVFGDMRIANFGGGLQLTLLGLDDAALGVDDYLKLAALFSMGFCVINLLPGPIVDGLAMILAGSEWIRRRPLPPWMSKAALPVGIVFAFGPLAACIIYEIMRALA